MMSNRIKIRVKNFCKDVIGISKYGYLLKIRRSTVSFLIELLCGLRDNYRNKGFGVVLFLLTARCQKLLKKLRYKAGIRRGGYEEPTCRIPAE